MPLVTVPERRKKLEHVLTAARRLPTQAQAELAEVLLREAAARAAKAVGQPALEPLRGLSEGELVALATGVIAPARVRRMKALLRRNEQGDMPEKLRRELDELLEAADRMALLKAKAAYTLSQLHGPRTAAA